MASRNSRDFNLRFKSSIDLDGLQNDIRSIESFLNKVDLSKSLEKKLKKVFDGLESEFLRISELSSKEFNNLGDINKLKKSTDNITGFLNVIDKELIKLSDRKISFYSETELQRIAAINKLLDEQRQKVQTLSTEQKELFDSLKQYNFSYSGSKEEVNELIKLSKEGKDYSKVLEKIRTNINNNKKAHGENADLIRNQEKEVKKAEAEYNKLNTTIDEHIAKINELKAAETNDKEQYDRNQKDLKNLEAKLKRREEKYINPKTGEHYKGKLADSTATQWKDLAAEAKELEKQIKLKKEEIQRYRELRNERLKLQKDLVEEKSNLKDTKIAVEASTREYDNLVKAQQALDTQRLDTLILRLEELRREGKNSTEAIDILRKELLDIDTTATTRAANEFVEVDDKARKAVSGVGELKEEVSDLVGRGVGLQNISDQFDDIYSRAISFFSIENSIDIFRDSVRQAYNSVKELDAAMTDIAVVTDFEVGDVWDTIPEYTDLANQLGTTILGAYETAKLYYQQGLEEAEVMKVSAETMKMARIANMDYSKATDYMTASIRGFKLEMQDAAKINDVFSKLAAISAADTEEIASALTRTASIANSAGMSLETTSAFLTQMINFAIRTRVA